jgi:hypothetical protein
VAALKRCETITVNEAVTGVNVRALMPADWAQQIVDLVAGYGRHIILKGGQVSTSMEESGFTTAYTVVQGTDVERQLPWLWSLYLGSFRRFVSRIAQQKVSPDPDKEFAVNVNSLSRASQIDGYELHTDVNNWTALLAVNTMRPGDGGELTHLLPDGRRVTTRTQAGWLYIFDGKTHPHKVERLDPSGTAAVRITVPMDYVSDGLTLERPHDLEAIFGR